MRKRHSPIGVTQLGAERDRIPAVAGAVDTTKPSKSVARRGHRKLRVFARCQSLTPVPGAARSATYGLGMWTSTDCCVSGADERGLTSPAAQRTVPVLQPFAMMLRRQVMKGRATPADARLCPGEKPGDRNSGLLLFEALQARADRAWSAAKLERITAH
jgi:hypothetical protein